ncbi:MAG TPA: protein kinase [Blastocatellia bacterium]|nr:protein kinase [Blastocatellia bacterium]
MKTERFRQIDNLFDEAIEREAGERLAFLDEACAGDEDLRKEVESLLRAYERVGNFIQTPAIDIAAKAMADDKSALKPGREMGPFRIVSLLGAGGMGEVYLAEDSRLGRKVALKLLPAEFTKDPERVSRFEREARSASTLNHPNIITIYEIGKVDDTHFIATEYIDGQTLRHRITGGRINSKESLDIGIQISSALAEAHAAGIVHRDIKPENIMLRPDGYVKVLDFGLAKLTEHKSSEVSQESLTARTESGRVMGTVNYMSPEQALGQALDQRTDIFSLGVVLYEMVTGTHPFKSGSVAATFDAILNRAPVPLSDSDPGLHVELDRIIMRSLEKDREHRYQTASDLRAELKRLGRDTDSSLAVAAVKSSTSRRLQQIKRTVSMKQGLIALVILAVAAIAWLLVLTLSREVEQKPDTPIISSALPVTDAAGEECFPNLSPDGKSLVYVSEASGNLDIYHLRVGGKNSVNLTSDSVSDDTHPAYSPDGELIAFRSEREGGGIFIMGASGESVRRLTDFGYNPSWSPDGKQIVCAIEGVASSAVRFVPKSQLWAVDVATHNKRLITEGDGVQPAWSPHGHRIAYWNRHTGGQRDIWTISANKAVPIQVTDDAFEDWNPTWSPDGKYLFFVSTRGGNMNVWRVAIEEQTGKVLGEPEPVTLPSSSAQHICLSRDGQRMAYVQRLAKVNIQKLEFNPLNEMVSGSPAWVTEGAKHITDPKLSPDGEWFTHDAYGDRQSDIFVIKKDGTGQRNLTQDAYKDLSPEWSPDGKQIAFYSDRSGTYQIWTIKPDGSGLQQLTFAPDPGAVYPVWSPDGSRLAYSVYSSHSYIIDLNKPWHEQTPQPVAPMDDPYGIFVAYSWSPDGQKLVGTSADSRIRKLTAIHVYWLDSQKYEKVTDFGDAPQWLSDGRRFIFAHQNKVYIVDTQTKKPRALFPLAPHDVSEFKISKDDRMIYYSITTKEADIWLATLEQF